MSGRVVCLFILAYKKMISEFQRTDLKVNIQTTTYLQIQISLRLIPAANWKILNYDCEQFYFPQTQQNWNMVQKFSWSERASFNTALNLDIKKDKRPSDLPKLRSDKAKTRKSEYRSLSSAQVYLSFHSLWLPKQC